MRVDSARKGSGPTVTWRAGRKVGRTIYFQVRGEPTDEDRLIGMMDTPELAAAAVEAYNAWERAQPYEPRRSPVAPGNDETTAL